MGVSSPHTASLSTGPYMLCKRCMCPCLVPVIQRNTTMRILYDITKTICSTLLPCTIQPTTTNALNQRMLQRIKDFPHLPIHPVCLGKGMSQGCPKQTSGVLVARSKQLNTLLQLPPSKTKKRITYNRPGSICLA